MPPLQKIVLLILLSLILLLLILLLLLIILLFIYLFHGTSQKTSHRATSQGLLGPLGAAVARPRQVPASLHAALGPAALHAVSGAGAAEAGAFPGRGGPRFGNGGQAEGGYPVAFQRLRQERTR